MSLLSDPNFPPSTVAGWPSNEETDPAIYDTSIDWPKISIVTPTFNQGQFIEETIRSVLLQNYPNLEYIIIDGGSKDETVAIIKKYEPWITYWTSEADDGQSAAINKGLIKCCGEIFNWLNSDDWYEPKALYEVAMAFTKQPSKKMISGFENHWRQDGSVSMYTGTFLQPQIEQTIELCEIAQPSTFFKLDIIKKNGGVSEDLHCIMDGEMWIKLLLLYGQESFSKIERVLVNFRFHDDSKTVKNVIENIFLFERCSIIAGLQTSAGVPREITTFYINSIYKTSKTYQLKRNWQFNDAILSKRKLRIYFIRKYVLKQFRHGNKKQAYWGIKQLIRDRDFGWYLFKNLLKLLLMKRTDEK